jgi:hypothetical protein
MIIMVRAKFKVISKNDGNVTLEVVTSGSKENEDFWKYTPSGLIQMGIDNEDALKHFEVGKEYYVDFTPAE